jgi:hypothetical protein
MRETDPVSKTLFGKTMMDNVQNNYHVYDNTPAKKHLDVTSSFLGPATFLSSLFSNTINIMILTKIISLGCF